MLSVEITENPIQGDENRNHLTAERAEMLIFLEKNLTKFKGDLLNNRSLPLFIF